MAYRYHQPLPQHIEKRFCEILGVSETEEKVLGITRKAPLLLSSIAFLLTIPRTSVAAAIKRLRKRGLLVQVGTDHKDTRWYSNLPVLFREIRTMQMPDTKAWMREDGFDENV